jgi:hypothetical protein
MVDPSPSPTKEQFLALVRELLSGKGLAATRNEGEAIAEALACQDGVTRARISRLLQILHPPKRKGSDQTAPGRDTLKHQTIAHDDPILDIIVEKDWDPSKVKTRRLVRDELSKRGLLHIVMPAPRKRSTRASRGKDTTRAQPQRYGRASKTGRTRCGAR